MDRFICVERALGEIIQDPVSPRADLTLAYDRADPVIIDKTSRGSIQIPNEIFTILVMILFEDHATFAAVLTLGLISRFSLVRQV